MFRSPLVRTIILARLPELGRALGLEFFLVHRMPDPLKAAVHPSEVLLSKAVVEAGELADVAARMLGLDAAVGLGGAHEVLCVTVLAAVLAERGRVDIDNVPLVVDALG